MSGERNYLANFNLLAVSANLKQTALGTEQTLDTTMLVSKSNLIHLEPRREDNSNEQTGMEEPDTVYDLGNLSNSTFDFEKAQAQHIAFGYAYALGGDAPSAWGTGFEHLITPTPDMSLPSFTGAGRVGQTIMKRRFADLFMDTFKVTYAKDSWVKASGGVKGTGKFTDSVNKETVSAAFNAASLTLAANAVQGADAATRLSNVHRIRVVVPTTGEWQEVAFSAVSGVAPAVITITPPGGGITATTYEILYAPTEPAWCAFPSRVSEPPLRVTDLIVKIGGKWNGTTFLGGRTLNAEINSIEHNINNQMKAEFRPGGTGNYANYALRGGRIQTLNLTRQMRDFILQQAIKDNEYFGVYLKATGAEFEAGKNYYVETVFPRVNVLKSPLSVNDKIVAEAGDLKVLQDATYGSVRVKVGNKVSGYAQ